MVSPNPYYIARKILEAQIPEEASKIISLYPEADWAQVQAILNEIDELNYGLNIMGLTKNKVGFLKDMADYDPKRFRKIFGIGGENVKQYIIEPLVKKYGYEPPKGTQLTQLLMEKNKAIGTEALARVMNFFGNFGLHEIGAVANLLDRAIGRPSPKILMSMLATDPVNAMEILTLKPFGYLSREIEEAKQMAKEETDSWMEAINRYKANILQRLQYYYAKAQKGEALSDNEWEELRSMMKDLPALTQESPYMALKIARFLSFFVEEAPAFALLEGAFSEGLKALSKAGKFEKLIDFALNNNSLLFRNKFIQAFLKNPDKALLAEKSAVARDWLYHSVFRAGKGATIGSMYNAMKQSMGRDKFDFKEMAHEALAFSAFDLFFHQLSALGIKRKALKQANELAKNVTAPANLELLRAIYTSQMELGGIPESKAKEVFSQLFHKMFGKKKIGKAFEPDLLLDLAKRRLKEEDLDLLKTLMDYPEIFFSTRDGKQALTIDDSKHGLTYFFEDIGADDYEVIKRKLSEIEGLEVIDVGKGIGIRLLADMPFSSAIEPIIAKEQGLKALKFHDRYIIAKEIPENFQKAFSTFEEKYRRGLQLEEEAKALETQADLLEKAKYPKKLIQTARKYKSAEEFVEKSGIIPEWGTLNQYYENNPYKEQLDKMKETGEFDFDIMKKAERWELKQVLKDKPAFLSENLSKKEVRNFASKHALWHSETKDGKSVVVARSPELGKKVLDALEKKDQRQLGLALGYIDIGVLGGGRRKKAIKELKQIYNLIVKQPQPEAASEATLKKIAPKEKAEAKPEEIQKIPEVYFTKPSTYRGIKEIELDSNEIYGIPYKIKYKPKEFYKVLWEGYLYPKGAEYPIPVMQILASFDNLRDARKYMMERFKSRAFPIDINKPIYDMSYNEYRYTDFEPAKGNLGYYLGTDKPFKALKPEPEIKAIPKEEIEAMKEKAYKMRQAAKAELSDFVTKNTIDIHPIEKMMKEMGIKAHGKPIYYDVSDKREALINSALLLGHPEIKKYYRGLPNDIKELLEDVLSGKINYIPLSEKKKIEAINSFIEKVTEISLRRGGLPGKVGDALRDIFNIGEGTVDEIKQKMIDIFTEKLERFPEKLKEKLPSEYTAEVREAYMNIVNEFADHLISLSKTLTNSEFKSISQAFNTSMRQAFLQLKDNLIRQWAELFGEQLEPLKGISLTFSSFRPPLRMAKKDKNPVVAAFILFANYFVDMAVEMREKLIRFLTYNKDGYKIILEPEEKLRLIRALEEPEYLVKLLNRGDIGEDFKEFLAKYDGFRRFASAIHGFAEPSTYRPRFMPGRVWITEVERIMEEEPGTIFKPFNPSFMFEGKEYVLPNVVDDWKMAMELIGGHIKETLRKRFAKEAENELVKRLLFVDNKILASHYVTISEAGKMIRKPRIKIDKELIDFLYENYGTPTEKGFILEPRVKLQAKTSQKIDVKTYVINKNKYANQSLKKFKELDKELGIERTKKEYKAIKDYYLKQFDEINKDVQLTGKNAKKFVSFLQKRKREVNIFVDPMLQLYSYINEFTAANFLNPILDLYRFIETNKELKNYLTPAWRDYFTKQDGYLDAISGKMHSFTIKESDFISNIWLTLGLHDKANAPYRVIRKMTSKMARAMGFLKLSGIKPGIINTTQLHLPASRIGFANTLKYLKELTINPEIRDRIERAFSLTAETGAVRRGGVEAIIQRGAEKETIKMMKSIMASPPSKFEQVESALAEWLKKSRINIPENEITRYASNIMGTIFGTKLFTRQEQWLRSNSIYFFLRNHDEKYGTDLLKRFLKGDLTLDEKLMATTWNLMDNFGYNSATLPLVMHHPLGQLIFMFRSYLINYLGVSIDNIKAMVKGAKFFLGKPLTDVEKEAFKRSLRWGSQLFAIAGLRGLPFFSILVALTGLDESDGTFADVLANGLPVLAGVQLTSSIQLQALPESPLIMEKGLALEPSKIPDFAMHFVGGVYAGTLMNMAKILSENPSLKGLWQAMINEYLPLKRIKDAVSGYYTSPFRPYLDGIPMTVLDRIYMTMGFLPFDKFKYNDILEQYIRSEQVRKKKLAFLRNRIMEATEEGNIELAWQLIGEGLQDGIIKDVNYLKQYMALATQDPIVRNIARLPVSTYMEFLERVTNEVKGLNEEEAYQQLITQYKYYSSIGQEKMAKRYAQMIKEKSYTRKGMARKLMLNQYRVWKELLERPNKYLTDSDKRSIRNSLNKLEKQLKEGNPSDIILY